MRLRIRGAVSGGWWRALAAVGLPQERWRALPTLWRRAVLAAVWVAIGLVLVAAFGVWRTSALLIALVAYLLALPWYRRLTVRGKRIGPWVPTVAILAI